MKKMHLMYLEFKAANTDVTKGEVNHEGYKDVAKQLAERFGFEQSCNHSS